MDLSRMRNPASAIHRKLAAICLVSLLAIRLYRISRERLEQLRGKA